MPAEEQEIATEKPFSSPEEQESPTEGLVKIDLNNPENSAALAEANVGDCVYLRITAKSDTELAGNVEDIEPMDEGDGYEDETKQPGQPRHGKDSDMPHGVMIVLGKRR